MNYFCTFFDYRYLNKGLALHRSLVNQCPSFHLWILAMDKETFELLSNLNLKSVTVFTVEDLDKDDFRVGIAKKNRSLIEFYFTTKPFLCLCIFKHNPEVDLITYLDADLFFFSDPQIVLNRLRSNSIGLTGHHFSKHLKSKERHGAYNAGWVSFRRDKVGLDGLNWWRDRCLEWCYDRVENERYADQKYLNLLPKLFKNVTDLQPEGINLAPWNIEDRQIAVRGGHVLVDGKMLVAFHFHGLRQILPVIYDSGLAAYQTQLTPPVRKHIFLPYLQVLSEETRKVPSHLLKQEKRSIRKEETRFKKLSLLFPSGLKLLQEGKKLLNCFFTHSYIILLRKQLKN